MSFVVALPAFRGADSSADTQNYIDFYLNQRLGYRGGTQETEIGYRLIQWLISFFFGNNWHAFISITSFISLIPIMFLIKKNSSNIFLSLFLFITIGPAGILYIFYFGIIRQCVAVGFICILMYTLYNKLFKKDVYYWALFILAVLCHTSMIVCLPFLFLSKIKFKPLMVFSITVFSLIIGMSDVSKLFLSISESTVDKNFYFDIIGNDTIKNITSLIPIGFVSLYMYYTSPKPDRQSLWLKTTIMTMWIINVLTFNVANNMERMVFPYFLFLIFSIPEYTSNKKISILYKIILLTFVISYYSLKFYLVLEYQFIIHDEFGSPVPYESYF